MQVKVNRRRVRFDPAAVDWKHQASPQTHFGIWEAPGGRVFVKRAASRPTGWGLLGRCRNCPLANTPRVFDLRREKDHYYIFFEWLPGDILSQVLQKGLWPEFFGSPELTDAVRLKIILGVYGTVRNLHGLGYWYPDLDFKNVFIVPSRGEFKVYLIDLDSCAPFGLAYRPDQVSQKFWEGLAKTYQEAGQPFLQPGPGTHPQVVPHGRVLNQSMLLLFAYAVQRLGKVPPELSLFDPLTHPKNPHGLRVKGLHQRWLHGENCRKPLESFLADFLKLDPNTFSRQLAKEVPPVRRGLFGLLARLLGG